GSAAALPTATSCAMRWPRRTSPITSCRRMRSSSTTPVRTSTPRRRCCRCRTASPSWWARPASPRASPCSPFPSGTASTALFDLTGDLLLQAVISGLLLGGVYGLVAFGLSLIFGVLRIINFAHGAVMMLAMYATYWLFTLFRIDPYVSIVLTGPAFFVLGMVIQRVVIEPNRGAAEHNQLLLTLGLALFLENLALVLWQGDFRTVRPSYATASFVLAESLGAALLPGSLKQLVVFALFVLVLLFRPAGLFGGGRGR